LAAIFSAQPCAAYIIQKLNPLSSVKRKTDFCEKLIALLDKFHDLKCVHGDVKLTNILCSQDGAPLFIDLDPYCFVDFTAFKNMNDRAEQWEHINQAGISSLYTPPKFQGLMHRYYKKENIDAAFKLLKIKDRYGLALALWELLRNKHVSNLEKGMELSQKSYEKIIKTTKKSKMMTDTLKDWVIEALKTGFSLTENDSADTSEISATASMNSSTSSITK
jgi:serine/threonine protein kinase